MVRAGYSLRPCSRFLFLRTGPLITYRLPTQLCKNMGKDVGLPEWHSPGVSRIVMPRIPDQSKAVARALCPYTSLSHTKAGYHAVVQDVTFDPRNYEAKRHSPQGTPSIQDSISSCRHSYAVAEACKAGRPAHTWTAQHSKQDPSAKNRQA